MLNEKFIKKGFAFIKPDAYINEENVLSVQDLKDMFDVELAPDQGYEFRKRAYLKLQWNRKTNQCQLHENQSYFQTAASNAVDGGKVRQFKVMNKKILNLSIMRHLLLKNLRMISKYQPLSEYDTLTIGLHFIRYIVYENSASFSSPDWLHKDDEPLVFVHLVGLSPTAIGGDNLIANDDKNVTHVIRLEKELDTLVLNKTVYHAVTPLGSRKGTAMRDVILFTVEPGYTQINSQIEKAA